MHSQNDPREFDANMFMLSLNNLEKTLKNLSKSLLDVCLAFLRIKIELFCIDKLDGGHVENKNRRFLNLLGSLDIDVIEKTSVVKQRNDAFVSLMEEGFGDRMWSFRAVS